MRGMKEQDDDYTCTIRKPRLKPISVRGVKCKKFQRKLEWLSVMPKSGGRGKDDNQQCGTFYKLWRCVGKSSVYFCSSHGSEDFFLLLSQAHMYCTGL